MLAGTALKRPFVHHDVGFTRFRSSHCHLGRTSIARNRDRQIGIGTVAFTILDRIAEADTCILTTGQTRVRLGRKRIAAVGIQRGNTVLRIYRVYAVRHRIGTVRSAFLVLIAAQIPGHAGAAVGTEAVRLARAVAIRKNIAADAGILRHAVHVVIGHRAVVMHFHGDRTLNGAVARGVHNVHRDRTLQFVLIIIAAVGILVRLISLEGVTVVHRPAAVFILRCVGHRHFDAIHRNRRRFRLAELTMLNLQLNLLLAIPKRNRAVFTVQIHRKRTRIGNAVFRMLTGTAVKRAFVHHDVGFTRFRRSHRHLGRTRISRNRDRQRRFRRIAVRIRNGIGKGFRNGIAIRHVHVGVQLVGISAVRVQRQLAMLALHRLTQRTAFNGRHRLVCRGVRAEHIVGQHVFTAAARLRLRFRKRDVVGTGHRHVVVHLHRERTTSRIARGVRHTDGNLARQGLVRRRIVSAMLLGNRKRVVIAYRPLAVRTQRRAGHRHGNAVHLHHAARHIGAIAGNGHLPAAFTAHGNHTVFAVQLHRERSAAALSMPFTTVFRLPAFVHHDVGFTRFRSSHRHHRNVSITFNGDDQRRFRRVAVRIRNGIGKFFRPSLILRHVHTGIQLIGVAAVRIQRQLAVSTFQRAADRTFRIAVLDGGYRLFGGAVRTEFIVVQYVAARCSRLCHELRKRNIVCAGRRHVVHNIHGDGAVDLSPVRIRYRHGKVVGNIVHAGSIVFRGAARKLILELQLARNSVEARHRQNAFVRGNGAARKRAVFKHGHAADDDGGHAVGRADGQRTGSRGRRFGLTGLRTVRKTGFVHRHFIRIRRRICRFDDDAVVHTVDGDGHGTCGNIAVRVRIGVGELFRQRLAVRQFLHRRIVVVEPVAVGTVGIQSDFAVPAGLVRIPRKIGAVRTGHGAFKRVARNAGLPFRHFMREAFDGRNVVGNHHAHHAGTRGTVGIRYRDHKVMRYLIVALAAVFLRGLGEMIGIVQPSGGGIEPRHFQIAFIRRNDCAGKSTVEHHDAVDDDGSNTIGSIDAHIAGGGSRSPLFSAQTGFLHRKNVAIGNGAGSAALRIAGSDEHRIVDIARARRTVRIGIHVTAGPADIQPAQAIQPVQQVGVHIVMKTVAVALPVRSGGTGGRHEVGLVHGHEEILTRDLCAVHLKGGHVFLGIGGIEVLELKSTAVFKGEDKVITGTGQRGITGGKIEDEAGFRVADDILGSSGGRLGKAYVGHDDLLKKTGKVKKEMKRKTHQRAKAPHRHTADAGLTQAEERKKACAKKQTEENIKKSCLIKWLLTHERRHAALRQASSNTSRNISAKYQYGHRFDNRKFSC